MDLRERVLNFINEGGTKAEAARRFKLARSSVYRYVEAGQKGALKPKSSWGHWRKLDPQKLREHVEHPDATLKELQEAFGVSHNAIWVRLRQMKFTLKKTHHVSRAQRGSTLAVPAGAKKPQPRKAVLSGRVRRGSSVVS